MDTVTLVCRIAWRVTVFLFLLVQIPLASRFNPKENKNIMTQNAALRRYSSHNALLEFAAEVQLAENRGYSLIRYALLARFPV